MKYESFCLQSNNHNISREKLAIYEFALQEKKHIVQFERAEPNHIPIGSIEFCEGLHEIKQLPIDFYPKFLGAHLHRGMDRVTFAQDHIYFGPAKFLKSANTWKSDIPAQNINNEFKIPKGEYYMSDIVIFVQEWRYYICGGEVITTGWYAGQDDDEPAPDLGIDFPPTFNAALDFGRLDNGAMAMVECHQPFACGWYGERSDNYKYGYWQYNSIRNIFNEIRSYRN